MLTASQLGQPLDVAGGVTAQGGLSGSLEERWLDRTRSNSCPALALSTPTPVSHESTLAAEPSQDATMSVMASALELVFSEAYLQTNQRLLRTILNDADGWIATDLLCSFATPISSLCSSAYEAHDLAFRAAAGMPTTFQVKAESLAQGELRYIRRIAPLSASVWTNSSKDSTLVSLNDHTGCWPSGQDPAMAIPLYQPQLVPYLTPGYLLAPHISLPVLSSANLSQTFPVPCEGAPLAYHQVVLPSHGLFPAPRDGATPNSYFTPRVIDSPQAEQQEASPRVRVKLSGRYWGLNCFPKTLLSHPCFPILAGEEQSCLPSQLAKQAGSHQGKLFGVVKYTTASYGFIEPLSDVGTAQLFFPFANIVSGSSCSVSVVKSAPEWALTESARAKSQTSVKCMHVVSNSASRSNSECGIETLADADPKSDGRALSTTTTIRQPSVAVGDLVSFYYAYERRGPRATCLCYVTPKTWANLIKQELRNCYDLLQHTDQELLAPFLESPYHMQI